MADTYKVMGAAALVIRESGPAQLFYRNAPVPKDATNLEALLASGTVGKVEDGDYAGGHPSDLPLDYVAPGFTPGDGVVGVDYKSLKVGELEAEVKRRNEGRDEEKLIKPDSGKKDDLVSALELDDAVSE